MIQPLDPFAGKANGRPPRSLRRASNYRGLLRRLLHVGLTRAGIDRLWVRNARWQGATILVYHSITDPAQAHWIDPRYALARDAFAEHMRFLASKRRVLPLWDVVAMIQRGESAPTGSVAITFDDGYLDNYTVAAPILASLGLPATFFVVTGFVDDRRPQLVDQIYIALRNRTSNRLDLRGLGARVFDLARRREADAAFGWLDDWVIRASVDQRRELFDDLHRQLAPAPAPPRLTLSWDDVRALAGMSPGFEIGAHTRNHLALTSHAREVVDREVQESADALQRELGRPARLFSYPYGRHAAATREAVAARFQAAAATAPTRPARKEDDVLALPRVEAPQSLHLLQFYTSGAFPDLASS